MGRPVQEAGMTTKDRLVETAARLFASQGYHATGMADILTEANVHRGSLYHAFPAKKDLLVAVLEAHRNGIGERLLKPAFGGIDDPVERVLALLARYRRFLEETHCFFACPIGSLALELREPDEEVRALLAGNFDAWIRAVELCLIEARDRLAPEVDRRALAIFALTTMEGGVMLARTYRRIEPFDTAVAHLRAYLEALIRPAWAREDWTFGV